MCGIIGYIGEKKALPILIDGLKKLEYRGYDSAGVAFLCGSEIKNIKTKGEIKNLEKQILKNKELAKEGPKLNLGIGHTRWATHGKPTEINAHPHSDCQDKIWLAHNGIIENYQELKEYLISRKHIFKSETDTEVLAHLIEEFLEEDLKSALQKALKLIKGTYGLVVVHALNPDRILAARCGSPLIIGLGDGETIISSDASGIISHTKNVIYLGDYEMAEIKAGEVKIFNLENKEIDKNIERIDWNLEKAQLGGFPYFLEKEIFEQSDSVINVLRGRLVLKENKVKLGGLEKVQGRLDKIKRIILVACGTTRYAAFYGKYLLEEYAQIPIDVVHASEFRYSEIPMDENTAVIAISQSGETADTLAALRKAKAKNILTLGIVNTVGSSIAREADAGIYHHIGPEISVASTKFFISQLIIFVLLAVYLGQEKNIDAKIIKAIFSELENLPKKIDQILKQSAQIKEIAKEYYRAKNFAFLGRKYNAAIAMEGALKLKELSYIHAEGFLAGDLKHGPLAMIDPDFPSIFIIPEDSVYEKNLSNLAEIKARDGKVIAIANIGDKKIAKIADRVIYVPKSLEILMPILNIIPLQLFAYHMAVLRGLNVDRPRNLAKSVTVE